MNDQERAARERAEKQVQDETQLAFDFAFADMPQAGGSGGTFSRDEALLRKQARECIAAVFRARYVNTGGLISGRLPPLPGSSSASGSRSAGSQPLPAPELLEEAVPSAEPEVVQARPAEAQEPGWNPFASSLNLAPLVESQASVTGPGDGARASTGDARESRETEGVDEELGSPQGEEFRSFPAAGAAAASSGGAETIPASATEDEQYYQDVDRSKREPKTSPIPF